MKKRPANKAATSLSEARASVMAGPYLETCNTKNMKIELLRLRLQNFKGIRSQDLKFKKITNISGDNATGKTTIFDAFLFLFFGKDSSDRKDFNIKTLDSNNEALHKLDHEVEAEMLVDGKKAVIRRLYQENWVNPKGSPQQKMQGHVQSFFWNEVPLKLEEFQAKVAKILPETLFKLITNVAYFNELKWQDRRKTLEDMAGEMTPSDVIDSLHSRITRDERYRYDALLNTLNEGKSIEEYQKEISLKKKKLKDELQLLPARIDEADRALPEEQDFDLIDKAIARITVDLEAVEGQLMNQSKAQKVKQDQLQGKIRLIGDHRSRMQTIEFEEKNKIKELRHGREEQIADVKRELRSNESELSSLSQERGRLQLRKPDMEKNQAQGRIAWTAINADKLEWKDGQFCCPTCKQDLPADQVDKKKKELTDNFNTEKTRLLEENVRKGKSIGVELTALNARVGELEEQEKALQTEISSRRSNLNTLESSHTALLSKEALETQRAIASNKEYNELKDKIAALEEEVNAPQDQDTSKDALLSQKRALDEELRSQRDLASTRKARESGLERIKKLKQQESDLAAQLSDLEGVEYSILQYTKAKMDLLEARINGKFKMVKFKLFDQQINGGEDPCCETLVKGVPYRDLNNAAKINAGLDIINTLCAHYNAYAPVFIDNAESVNTLLPVNSQLVRLVVSKDKKLKVEFPQEELFETETV
jgi:exonuclease SbcC